jgi:cytochrome c oxidase assembly factor CtaG
MEPVGIVGVALPTAAYAFGLSRVWRTAGPGRVVSLREARTFGVGMAVMAVALVSPLAGAADRDLSMHMIQHVLLIGVVAPLVALGAPFPTYLWVLPARLRGHATIVWRRVTATVAGTRWTTWLAVALVVHVVVMVGWHVPVLYDAAVRNALVHGVEHLSFVVTSVVFWWVAMGAGRRAAWGAGVIAAFLASLSGIALGAAMTFATRPWYRVYGSGLRALREQQVAGVAMWAFGGIAALASAMYVLWRWLEDPEPGSRIVGPGAHANRGL